MWVSAVGCGKVWAVHDLYTLRRLMTLFQSRGVFICVPESLTALHNCTRWAASLCLASHSLENNTTAEQPRLLRAYTCGPGVPSSAFDVGNPNATERGDVVYITSGSVL